jgi:RNA polymerase sigma factor (sigma-70 family)
MPTGQLSGVLRQIRRVALLNEGGDLTDGQLLDHFLAQHDETAFEALVRRHGPMVMGVCRRVLRNAHDAEDAFQATFLVLVRKAASIVPREMVGNWLYGVAYRTALGARTASARRQAKEKEMSRHEALGEDIWGKLRPLLDHELNHLPDKYRVPIVLCDLESKSRKEAAHQLGWPEGTLSGRLARARILLAKRLSARGLTLSGGALAATLGGNAVLASVPPALLMSTVKAATLSAAGAATTAGVVPVKVAVLMQGVLRAMVLTKVKTATGWLLAIAVLGGGVGMINYPAQVAAQVNSKAGPVPTTAPEQGTALVPLPTRDTPTKAALRPAPRRIEAKDTLNIRLVRPIAGVPDNFLGWHTVNADGTIYLGESYSLSVRGQTLEKIQAALAHLCKRWYRPDMPIEEIKKNLQVTLASAEDKTKPKQYGIQLTVMRVERVPGTAGVRETHQVEASPQLMLLEGSEGKCVVGLDPAAVAPGTTAGTTGLSIAVKATEWQDGRLRLETRFEQCELERNDKDGSRVAIRAVNAVDVVAPGDPVKVDVKNDKGEIRHYVILKTARVDTEAHDQPTDDLEPAQVGEMARIGDVKIVGNSKIPVRLILDAVPLVPGAVLRDTDVRRAERNLARLGLFEMNAAKNIRPTVTVLETNDGSGFKDIVVRVKEK